MTIARRPQAHSAALSLLLLLAAGARLSAQTSKDEYEDVDPWAGVKPPEPGPDSTAIAGFLQTLAASDPVLCQFAVRAIGSHWGSGTAAMMSGT